MESTGKPKADGLLKAQCQEPVGLDCPATTEAPSAQSQTEFGRVVAQPARLKRGLVGSSGKLGGGMRKDSRCLTCPGLGWGLRSRNPQRSPSPQVITVCLQELLGPPLQS